MKRFVLDMPDELHQGLKAACTLEGKTMKQVAPKMLEKCGQKVGKKLKKQSPHSAGPESAATATGL